MDLPAVALNALRSAAPDGFKRPLRAVRDHLVFDLGFGAGRYLPKPPVMADFGRRAQEVQHLHSFNEEFLPACTFKIIAHRGARLDAQENTVEAFHLARAQGANVMEIDIWLSKDGQLVLRHDASATLASGEDRPVTEVDFAELRSLGICSLEEAFRQCPDLGFILDIKDGREKAFTATVGLVEKYGMAGSVLYEGEFACLDCMRYWRMPRLELSERLPHGSKIGRKIIRRAKQEGRFVYAAVGDNNPERMAILIDLGVDGIFTPHVKTLHKVAVECGIAENTAGFSAPSEAANEPVVSR